MEKEQDLVGPGNRGFGPEGYIDRKTRHFASENAKENTRSFLYNYDGDDKGLRKAQRCFKRNLGRGQDAKTAFSGCGLEYTTSDTEAYAGTKYGRSRSGRHKRQGIKGIENIAVRSSEWVDKRS